MKDLTDQYEIESRGHLELGTWQSHPSGEPRKSFDNHQVPL